MRCDCGFDFSKVSPELLKAEFDKAQREALRRAVRGVVLGIGLVALSFILSAVGVRGPYIVFLWPAFAGLATAGRSITRLVDIRKARRESNNPTSG